MPFMQPQIYFGGYFLIETTIGTECVPDDVIGRTVGTHVEAFANYLEGKPLDDDECVEHRSGWLARLSAPGYLDCTDWSWHATEQEAENYLMETYDLDDEECTE
jgi:hypothetical protein